MDKELTNLLDNYENVIYGKSFPINPSIHQLHLLLDYIANLEQQCKKQKKVIDKAIEYIRIYRSYQKIDNKDYLKGRDEIGCLCIYQVDELLDLLNEVSE